ncbi:Hypothetical predicted protein [Podarcis lilfordi]|uniref:Uncharacterized protein n=1 Tax=Podarcis lilfordi TaxID=74358 RepID=A0AA35LAC4_9SAUR|nr:Hypothetical predicted protein [Podarcis lilfordi]
MDEVWVVYLCMVLFAIIVILMRQKPDDEIRKETETPSASASTSSYSSSSGSRMECKRHSRKGARRIPASAKSEENSGLKSLMNFRQQHMVQFPLCAGSCVSEYQIQDDDIFS